MAKIGKKPLPIPDKVKVTLGTNEILVEGPKGKLTQPYLPGIQISIKDSVALVQAEEGHERALPNQGLMRGLLGQMIIGVTQGFKKELELQGVGIRAAVKGTTLELSLGFSHIIKFPIKQGIAIKAIKPTQLVIEGINKVQVGETAAQIRSYYPPEPYKGKGIRYKDEYVRRKQGKAVG
jgi:large subunit ribosomal protein L6